MNGVGSEAFEPTNPDYARQVRASFARQRFMAHLGVELSRPGRAKFTCRTAPRSPSSTATFTAGRSARSSAMGYAGYSLAPAGSSVLTVEYKINLLAPGEGERLVARGRVVRAGRTLTVCRGEVFAIRDGAETLCATAQQTLMILEARADEPR